MLHRQVVDPQVGVLLVIVVQVVVLVPVVVVMPCSRVLDLGS